MRLRFKELTHKMSLSCNCFSCMTKDSIAICIFVFLYIYKRFQCVFEVIWSNLSWERREVLSIIITVMKRSKVFTIRIYGTSLKHSDSLRLTKLEWLNLIIIIRVFIKHVFCIL